MGKTFICPSESIAIFQHFKRWPTCSRRALRPAKIRVSILLPVSARKRAKPDTAKVNGNYNVKKQISSAPQIIVQLYQMLSSSLIVPGGRYVLQKNRVSILLPVSARERAKPDTTKVN